VTELSDAELGVIQRRVDAATPGPWFVRQLDDSNAASLTAVCSAPGPDVRWPDFDAGEVIAGTLIQWPVRYVSVADHKWDDNAELIAHARTDIPRLIEEIHRLRSLL
jgi:hypothetical protein